MTGTRRLTRRYSRSDASVSIAIASTPGIDLARREADGLLLELRGDVALGVDLDEQHALPVARGEQRGGRGHRALADTALAREEQAAAIEQVRTLVDHETCYREPKPTLRSASAPAIST